MQTIKRQVQANGYTISQVVRFGRKFDFEWRHVIRSGKPTIKFNEVDGMTVLNAALCQTKQAAPKPKPVEKP